MNGHFRHMAVAYGSDGQGDGLPEWMPAVVQIGGSQDDVGGRSVPTPVHAVTLEPLNAPWLHSRIHQARAHHVAELPMRLIVHPTQTRLDVVHQRLESAHEVRPQGATVTRAASQVANPAVLPLL